MFTLQLMSTVVDDVITFLPLRGGKIKKPYKCLAGPKQGLKLSGMQRVKAYESNSFGNFSVSKSVSDRCRLSFCAIKLTL